MRRPVTAFPDGVPTPSRKSTLISILIGLSRSGAAIAARPYIGVDTVAATIYRIHPRIPAVEDAVGIVARRAAKALRRKAIVKAKRGAERLAARRDSGDHPMSSTYWPSHKASAALIDLAQPLLEEAEEGDRKGRRMCLMFAALAWNLSLLAADERQARMLDFFNDLSAASGYADGDRAVILAAFEDAMAQLISRKLLLYPDDRRCLADLNINETSDSYHVTVTSLVETA